MNLLGSYYSYLSIQYSIFIKKLLLHLPPAIRFAQDCYARAPSGPSTREETIADNIKDFKSFLCLDIKSFADCASMSWMSEYIMIS